MHALKLGRCIRHKGILIVEEKTSTRNLLPVSILVLQRQSHLAKNGMLLPIVQETYC